MGESQFLFMFSVTENAETARDCRAPSNQCIFYPVKEEEREVLLGTSTGSSSPEGSDNTTQAANCDTCKYLSQSHYV